MDGGDKVTTIKVKRGIDEPTKEVESSYKSKRQK